MYPTRQQFALAVYQPIDPDHLFAANVHMRDEPRSVIEDVHDLWTQLLLLNMFFPFQYSAAASCRFPSEGGGVSLFVRPLAIVHTGDARTHVRGTRWTHVPPRSCMETSEIISSSRRAFPRPGGHKTGPTKLEIGSARGCRWHNSGHRRGQTLVVETN